MNKFIILCKEKDHTNLTMFHGLSARQAQRKVKDLKKHGASQIQLRVATRGLSSVLVERL